jgi:hypothetical protein
VRLGPAAIRFPAVHLPDIQHEPVVDGSSVRFVQTVGGRMGLPTPRPVSHKPFVQFWPSIAWTTLELTIHADGSHEQRLVGASPFPRHWVYDDAGTLVEKSGVVDFRTWFNDSFGDHTPWGSFDSPAVVSAVESEMERRLSGAIMHGGSKPRIRTLDAGEVLIAQGDAATELYLILDGMFVVEVDGREVAEIGPGAVVGSGRRSRGPADGDPARDHPRPGGRGGARRAGPLDADALAATHHRSHAGLNVGPARPERRSGAVGRSAAGRPPPRPVPGGQAWLGRSPSSAWSTPSSNSR